MATTIGHLALMISAQTDGLRSGMNEAAKIAEKGAGKIKDSIERRTAWGDMFRGAFALSMFNRFVGAVEKGTALLEKSGDAAAAAARGGLREYQEAVEEIQKTIAEKAAPALGLLGQSIKGWKLGLESGYEVLRSWWKDGDSDKNLAERMDARTKVEAAHEKMLLRMQQEKDRLKRFSAEVEFFRPKADELLTPFHKHAIYAQRVSEALKLGVFASKELADNLIRASSDAILKNLGLLFEPGPVDRYLAVLRNIDEAQRVLGVDAERAAIMQREHWDKLLNDLKMARELDPFEKWAESTWELNKLLSEGIINMDELLGIMRDSGQQLLKSMGLAVQTPLMAFKEAQERLFQMMRSGAINEDEMHLMLGNQAKRLLGDRQDKAPEIPRLMLRGSSEALGAIQAFRSPDAPSGEKKWQELLLKANQEEAKDMKELRRLGASIDRNTKKQPMVVGK